MRMNVSFDMTEEAETEETIKKSRFIGRCGPAATFEDAKALLGR